VRRGMKKTLVAITLVLLAGCAVRLGGRGPVVYDTVGIEFEDGLSVDAAAARLREQGTDLALLLTKQDSNWVRQLARQMQLESTRPGKQGDYTMAFLAGKPLGDTTLTINLRAGGAVRIHDALYNVDNVKKPTDPSRKLDLMLVMLDPGTNVRLAVDTLLDYIANDVGGTSAVVLAVHTPTPVLGDSIVALTRAYMADAWECTPGARDTRTPPALPIRMFYFPAVRIRCETAKTLDRAMVARLIVP
jgi:hypothetical protein